MREDHAPIAACCMATEPSFAPPGAACCVPGARAVCHVPGVRRVGRAARSVLMAAATDSCRRLARGSAYGGVELEG